MNEQNTESVRLCCDDFPTLPACCDSCHDDYDEGYDEPIEAEHEDSPLVPEGAVAHVCCSKWMALEDAHIDGYGGLGVSSD